jgi:hypothetical protein
MNRELGDFLGRLVGKYHRRDLLASDPLEFVHRYVDPQDQEAVALVSALLAYGNVRQIRASIESLFARLSLLEHSPAQAAQAAVTDAGYAELRRAFRG